MPTRPKTHAELMRERDPQARPLTAAARGYDRQWRKERLRFLRRNPLCLYCRRQQRERMAGLVDHNPPHLGDQAKFWDTSTWVPCCTECHAHVTPTYDGGGGHPVRPRDGVYVAAAPGELTEL